MRILVVLISFITVTSAVSLDAHLKKEWKTFKLRYDKKYATHKEEMFRLKCFLRNKQTIRNHNDKSVQGLGSYYLGLNEYADWTSEEFKKFTISSDDSDAFNIEAPTFKRKRLRILGALPKEINWVEKGAVTSVKNQGSHCNSCYAFSAIGAVEGHNFIKNNKLVNLSAQNVIDCSWEYKNSGCAKGGIGRSLLYIIYNHGVDTEEAYPYTGKDGTCKFNKNKIGATLRNFDNCKQYDEYDVMQAVAYYGPITAAVDFTHDSIMLYHSGIYDEPCCSDTDVNHAVLIVGYGTDKNGTDYWLVKNTWGPSWGISGYIKMSRNKNNQCGIASFASYLYPD